MAVLNYHRERSVLVTGAAGMLARAFRKALQLRGWRAEYLTREQCDIADPGITFATLDDRRPDICINCAAYTNVDLAEREMNDANAVNGTGAGGLAEACIKYGATLVHFSSDYVFDGSLHRPLRPDDPVGPQSAYGRSKLLGEQLIRKSASQNYLILRTSWLYGPGGPNFVQTMLNAARAGKKLSVIDDQIGSPTFTHDLAEATLEMIDRGARGIHHITNSGQTSWFGFAQAIFEEFGLKPDLSPTTSAAWKQSHPASATRPAYSVLDCSENEKIIGRKLPDWREALHRYRLEIENNPR